MRIYAENHSLNSLIDDDRLVASRKRVLKIEEKIDMSDVPIIFLANQCRSHP